MDGNDLRPAHEEAAHRIRRRRLAGRTLLRARRIRQGRTSAHQLGMGRRRRRILRHRTAQPERQPVLAQPGRHHRHHARGTGRAYVRLRGGGTARHAAVAHQQGILFQIRHAESEGQHQRHRPEDHPRDGRQRQTGKEYRRKTESARPEQGEDHCRRRGLPHGIRCAAEHHGRRHTAEEGILRMFHAARNQSAEGHQELRHRSHRRMRQTDQDGHHPGRGRRLQD